MAYLLGITVGPVQLNIQESKKLKDLCNSSKITSDLMRRVNEYLRKKEGDSLEVIYPHILENDLLGEQNLTNYMICRVEKIDYLKDMEACIYEQIEQEKFKNILKEMYFMFWAVEPIKNYDETYLRLSKKLRSIKNTYYFENSQENNRDKKCSICGKRTRMNKSEDLCEVCSFKRNYKDTKYLSTYGISIQYWHEKYNSELINLDRILASTFKYKEKYYNIENISNLIELLNGKNSNEVRIQKEINEDLIYRNIQTDKLIACFEDAKVEMEKIFYSETNSVKEPHYKYCFLQIDIDDLGKWMSGRWNKDGVSLENSQKELSKYLSRFAFELKRRLEKEHVIYAGGDDLLAIIPVEKLWDILKIIEGIFHEVVIANIDMSRNYKKDITYSTSITLVGCKEDMSLALRHNRLTLEETKERFKYKSQTKNAVGINYIVNNSKMINTFISRETFKKFIYSLNTWEKVKTYFSFKYVDAFESEFEKMKFNDLANMEKICLREMMQIEFERNLNKNKTKENKEEFQKYFEIHRDLFEKIVAENTNESYIDFDNIINSMKIYENLTKFEYIKGGDKI